MMKRMLMLSLVTILSLGFALPAAQTESFAYLSASSPVAPMTIPLYRYQSKNASISYAALPAYRQQLYGSLWKESGVVGHVFPKKQPSTLPLLGMRKATEEGMASIYFYTTDFKEAMSMQNQGWLPIQGYHVIGYVSPAPRKGTIPVYRYRQPAAQGGYRYAFGEGENNSLGQSAGLVFEKIAFHVWAHPVESAGSQQKQSDFPSGGPGDSSSSTGGVDLSAQKALYLLDASNETSKYATPTTSMKLKKSEALSCKADTCTFQLGVVVTRSVAQGKLNAYAKYTADSHANVGNTVIFAPNQKTKDFAAPLELKVGVNKIEVSVYPENQTVKETNENNNTFEVTVIVEP